jgi:hypothetical protein
VASIVTPEKEVTPKFFPFEFTPLYVGMPSVASYNKPIPLGGGFVEPLGFNSQPPRKKALSKTGSEVRIAVAANLSRSRTTFSVCYAVQRSQAAVVSGLLHTAPHQHGCGPP